MATTEVRTPEASFDIHIPESLPYLNVDGVTQIQMGFPNSRILFHVTTNAPSPTEVEKRLAIANLSINTAGLAEFCLNVLMALIQNKGQLESGLEQFHKQTKAIFDRINASSIQPPGPRP
jgi:hypothetical protein